MKLIPYNEKESLFTEALGAALIALNENLKAPDLSKLTRLAENSDFEKVPALKNYLNKVTRLKQTLPNLVVENKNDFEIILGFDIGSTGSKIVAIDYNTKKLLWESYVNTNGNPVSASQALMQKYLTSSLKNSQLKAIGTTGSGREIVGSLMTNCYGPANIFVLNEIAAHAEGALFFNSKVDTIFEIGGQDAKYIRLSKGRVIDAAMNEACSAGTGSFIEEQGKKFSNIDDIVQMGEAALEASSGVSLGQHCSVFMAEIIDEAVAGGEDNTNIVAGIYDSIIQNYLNRVKGSRSTGDVIFCQGMPFSSDALAAAVARQTNSEVIIPPNPGTTGALGIALLTKKSLNGNKVVSIDADKFLTASIEKKDSFNCKSSKGCGGSGNLCKIDRITTLVANKKQKFTWGGACSLWEKASGKIKLPDLAPDPFKERNLLIKDLVLKQKKWPKGKTISITDEFQLKGLFPFFISFLNEMGFNLKSYLNANQSILKRGIEEANISYCAPMQQYQGLLRKMAEGDKSNLLFLPMIKDVPKSLDEPNSVFCPIVQGSSDILKLDLGKENSNRILSPIISLGDKNLESPEFINSCKQIAVSLKIKSSVWKEAHKKAVQIQNSFEDKCFKLGDEALNFCKKNDIIPIVVQGRAYTIHNTVLNSNVPSILREQGAIAIPIDCYKVSDEVPVFKDMYWGYGQRNLRAAHQIRRSENIYSIWCSNYSCGPDSFNLHFYSYIMDGKPHSIIETDGHSGDAGTRTRVEAFLHCVKEDLVKDDLETKTDNKSEQEKTKADNNNKTVLNKTKSNKIDIGKLCSPCTQSNPCTNFKKLESSSYSLADINNNKETFLLPRMGPGVDALASALKSFGVKVEALPAPNRESLRLGRKYTSGKECVPMTITLGSLLQRLEKVKDPNERFAFMMPTANGPCRFGIYNVLHKIVVEKLNWQDRLSMFSPSDTNYFDGLPPGFSILLFSGFAAEDMILAALYDTRPLENKKGSAIKLYKKYTDELHSILENIKEKEISIAASMQQVISNKFFGISNLLKRASIDFAKIKKNEDIPTVSMVGEIYVRCDPFSNDFVIDKLEARGIRVRFAPFTEWLEYCDYYEKKIEGSNTGFSASFSAFVQTRIQEKTYKLMGRHLNWPKRTTVKDSLEAAAPYIRKELNGEAILTVGGPVAEWQENLIDGVISVGPLECMPTKIAENQFFHVAEKEGLLSLTLALNGDPVDPEIIDNFAFEIKSRYNKKKRDSS